MVARDSSDSSPTIVPPSPAPTTRDGTPKRSSTSRGSPPRPAPQLKGDPSVDTASLYRSSPALSFPANALYATAQFSLVVVVLPFHFLLFALFPSKRWRPSWTLTEAALMPAVKRIMSTMDTCGYKIGARRTDRAPGRVARWWMRVRDGVAFEWVEGLSRELAGGVLVDEQAKVREQVGMYVWRREGVDDGEGLVGLWLHGGAYTHNSAHPGASSSSIPRILFKREPRFSSICGPYLFFLLSGPVALATQGLPSPAQLTKAISTAVEYRLLPDSPFPAALQDAAAAYVSLLRRGIRGSQIVVMGDSSGGHLALALTRWIKETREERGAEEEARSWRLEEPSGLVLFSPWSDPSHSYLGHTASTYVPRKNSSDYVFESPPFRLHLVTSLLGSRPSSFVLSPYISPGSRTLAPGALEGFPPCFIHYGTSDRCEEEGERLVANLRRDGVRVETVVTEDTPHDLMLLAMIWRKSQVEQVWEGVLQFTGSLRR